MKSPLHWGYDLSGAGSAVLIGLGTSSWLIGFGVLLGIAAIHCAIDLAAGQEYQTPPTSFKSIMHDLELFYWKEVAKIAQPTAFSGHQSCRIARFVNGLSLTKSGNAHSESRRWSGTNVSRKAVGESYFFSSSGLTSSAFCSSVFGCSVDMYLWN